MKINKRALAAYKQWWAFGGAKVFASHNCSCIWTSDRSELRQWPYLKPLAAMLPKTHPMT